MSACSGTRSEKFMEATMRERSEASLIFSHWIAPSFLHSSTPRGARRLLSLERKAFLACTTLTPTTRELMAVRDWVNCSKAGLEVVVAVSSSSGSSKTLSSSSSGSGIRLKCKIFHSRNIYEYGTYFAPSIFTV